MAVDPHCIVERFYIFKHKPVCMAVIYDMEPAGSFSLDQGMEAFRQALSHGQAFDE